MIAKSHQSFNTVKAIGEAEELGLPILGLAGLLTSYFYVLPLGKYAVLGIASDFRLYDFIFIGFFLTIGLRSLTQLSQLWQDRNNFFRWGVFLLYLVWMSLGLVFALRGGVTLFIAALRAFRFSNYFLTAGYVIVLVDTPKRFRFIFWVIYINIVVQAVLGFAQGIEVLGTFWPSYWLDLYGERPVGTLSPHHKQIGIVMLLGIGLTISLISNTKDTLYRWLLSALFGIMLAVPLLSGSRSAWLGFAGLILGYIYIFRGKSFGTILSVGVILFIIFQFNQGWIREPLETQIDERFLYRLETQGSEGIYGERTVIYFDYLPTDLQQRPWIALIGTGFQNVSYSLQGATGAHNNYLQAWLELGIVGFVIYIRFLIRIWRQLQTAIKTIPKSLYRTTAQGAWISYIAILCTMFVGESLWAQYSMFTLTGQIMSLMALAIAPLYWEKTKIL